VVAPVEQPVAASLVLPLLDAGPGSPLAAAMRSVAPLIPWREPPQGEIEKYMGGRNCMSRLVGPDSLFRSDAIGFGTFYMAPDVLYPRHMHAAEEIYVVVSGGGSWALGDGGFEERGPGNVIHVTPWLPHALRANDQGLLMLWAWQGNIDLDAYRMDAGDDD
ncbi:MAG: cupin domain-containing protein, partial [Rhodospirillaceae bacterium]|nr:cupin domain-containing protein [Rhodospirillaceae bacterium]